MTPSCKRTLLYGKHPGSDCPSSNVTPYLALDAFPPVPPAQEDGTLEAVLEDREALRHVLRPISGQQPQEKEDTWVGARAGLGLGSWATHGSCVAVFLLYGASQHQERQGGHVGWGAGGPEVGAWCRVAGGPGARGVL